MREEEQINQKHLSSCLSPLQSLIYPHSAVSATRRRPWQTCWPGLAREQWKRGGMYRKVPGPTQRTRKRFFCRSSSNSSIIYYTIPPLIFHPLCSTTISAPFLIFPKIKHKLLYSWGYSNTPMFKRCVWLEKPAKCCVKCYAKCVRGLDCTSSMLHINTITHDRCI